ncbi:ankyrin repeat-containing protein At5g02620-like isoform X2 [Fagus crenata]
MSIDYMEKTRTTDPEIGVEDDAKIIEMSRKIYNAVFNETFNDMKEFFGGTELTSAENTILHIAAKYGKQTIVKKIIDSYPLVLFHLHKRNNKGNTPLHIAASFGHLDMTEHLLKSAEEVKYSVSLLRIQNEKKETALHVAVRNGHYKIVKLLVKKDGSLTSIINDNNESPLFMAVDRGLFKIADHILSNEKCSQYGGSKGMNALHAAIIRMHKSNLFKYPIQALLSRKGIASFLRDVLWSPLSDVLLALVNSLYQKEFPRKNFNRRNKIPITKKDFVGKILEKFPNAMLEVDDFGWTPLHYAAHFGEVEIVELFLEKDISLADKKDKEGMCALHISAKKGHVEVLKVFIKKCPHTCELLDNRKRTALHLAAESGRTEAVKLFVQTLAFQDLLNEQDDEGNTPFHLAATKGHYALLLMPVDVRRHYLSEGSLPSTLCAVNNAGAVNNKGKTILDIIKSDDQLMSNEKRIIMSHLKRRNVLRPLHDMVDRQTTKEQTLETKEYTKVRAGSDAANISEENDRKLAKERKKDDVKDMTNVNLLVATIITTVTFAAALQVPGGFNENGLAILSKNEVFINFLICDSLAFGFSAVSIFVNFAYPFLAKATRVTYPIILSFVLTELSLVCMVLAFVEGTKSVLDENTWLPYIMYSSLIPISYFLLRPIIVRKTFLYSNKTRALAWYL